jgi:hypothetical protein
VICVYRRSLRRRFASVSAIALSQPLVQRQFPPLHEGCSSSREFGGAVDVAAIFGVLFPAHLIDYFSGDQRCRPPTHHAGPADKRCS